MQGVRCQVKVLPNRSSYVLIEKQVVSYNIQQFVDTLKLMIFLIKYNLAMKKRKPKQKIKLLRGKRVKSAEA